MTRAGATETPVITVGRLPNDEFSRLESFHDGAKPDPASSIAVVAQDGNEIIGRIFLVAPAHIEGPYIEEAHRGGTIAKRLVSVAATEARKCGITKLMAYGFSPELEDYLERLGFKKQPVTVWAKEI
jgi:GNAT superfamily N-acetyltransferase